MSANQPTIALTLGARLMVMQAELLAERAVANTENWNDGFEKLLKGPDARMLCSIWSQAQRYQFHEYMLKTRAVIERRTMGRHRANEDYPKVSSEGL